MGAGPVPPPSTTGLPYVDYGGGTILLGGFVDPDAGTELAVASSVPTPFVDPDAGTILAFQPIIFAPSPTPTTPTPTTPTPTTPTPTPPLNFTVLRWHMTLASDDATPSSIPPSVAIYAPGQANLGWRTPSGPVVYEGDGCWALQANSADVAGGTPLLLYAWDPGGAADPADAIFWTGILPMWTANTVTYPFPFWLGTKASSGYSPDVGDNPIVQVKLEEGPFSAALGSVVEPGGVGHGNGFYLYYPGPTEVATAGEFVIYASAPNSTNRMEFYTIQ